MGEYVFVYHEAKIYAFGGNGSCALAERLNNLLEKNGMHQLNYYQLGYGENYERSDYKKVNGISDIQVEVMKRIPNIT